MFPGPEIFHVRYDMKKKMSGLGFSSTGYTESTKDQCDLAENVLSQKNSKSDPLDHSLEFVTKKYKIIPTR